MADQKNVFKFRLQRKHAMHGFAKICKVACYMINVLYSFERGSELEYKCIYHGLCNLFFGVLHGMLLQLLH